MRIVRAVVVSSVLALSLGTPSSVFGDHGPGCGTQLSPADPSGPRSFVRVCTAGFAFGAGASAAGVYLYSDGERTNPGPASGHVGVYVTPDGNASAWCSASGDWDHQHGHTCP